MYFFLRLRDAGALDARGMTQFLTNGLPGGLLTAYARQIVCKTIFVLGADHIQP